MHLQKMVGLGLGKGIVVFIWVGRLGSWDPGPKLCFCSIFDQKFFLFLLLFSCTDGEDGKRKIGLCRRFMYDVFRCVVLVEEGRER